MTNSSPAPFGPIRLRDATAADAATLERLWLLFRHDLSDVTGELPRPDGRFRDERLRTAIDEGRAAGWSAHLAESHDGRPVAFALVRGHGDSAGTSSHSTRVLSAFFVARAARRHRVGRHVAADVLRTAPGPWEIAYQDANAAAAAFWPRVATDVAGDRWSLEHRAVPGRPDVPPDAWLRLTVR